MSQSIADMLNDKSREQMKSMIKTNKTITELKPGEKADGFYLIKNFDVKKTTNGKQYIDIELVDKTGEINAKVWDYSKETEALIEENPIVKVRGEVLEWNGARQLKVNKIREKKLEDNVHIEELIPAAPIDLSEMLDAVKSYIGKIKDNEIRTLTDNILKKYEDKLYYYPAAKRNHHSYMGGLLYHNLRMLQYLYYYNMMLFLLYLLFLICYKIH